MASYNGYYGAPSPPASASPSPGGFAPSPNGHYHQQQQGWPQQHSPPPSNSTQHHHVYGGGSPPYGAAAHPSPHVAYSNPQYQPQPQPYAYDPEAHRNSGGGAEMYPSVFSGGAQPVRAPPPPPSQNLYAGVYGGVPPPAHNAPYGQHQQHQMAAAGGVPPTPPQRLPPQRQPQQRVTVPPIPIAVAAANGGGAAHRRGSSSMAGESSRAPFGGATPHPTFRQSEDGSDEDAASKSNEAGNNGGNGGSDDEELAACTVGFASDVKDNAKKKGGDEGEEAFDPLAVTTGAGPAPTIPNGTSAYFCLVLSNPFFCTEADFDDGAEADEVVAVTSNRNAMSAAATPSTRQEGPFPDGGGGGGASFAISVPSADAFDSQPFGGGASFATTNNTSASPSPLRRFNSGGFHSGDEAEAALFEAATIVTDEDIAAFRPSARTAHTDESLIGLRRSAKPSKLEMAAVETIWRLRSRGLTVEPHDILLKVPVPQEDMPWRRRGQGERKGGSADGKGEGWAKGGSRSNSAQGQGKDKDGDKKKRDGKDGPWMKWVPRFPLYVSNDGTGRMGAGACAAHPRNGSAFGGSALGLGATGDAPGSPFGYPLHDGTYGGTGTGAGTNTGGYTHRTDNTAFASASSRWGGTAGTAAGVPVIGGGVGGVGADGAPFSPMGRRRGRNGGAGRESNHHYFRLNPEVLMTSKPGRAHGKRLFLKVTAPREVLLAYAEASELTLRTHPLSDAGGAVWDYSSARDAEFTESVRTNKKLMRKERLQAAGDGFWARFRHNRHVSHKLEDAYKRGGPDRDPIGDAKGREGFIFRTPEKFRTIELIIRDPYAFGGCGLQVKEMVGTGSCFVEDFFPLHDNDELRRHGLIAWCSWRNILLFSFINIAPLWLRRGIEVITFSTASPKLPPPPKQKKKKGKKDSDGVVASSAPLSRYHPSGTPLLWHRSYMETHHEAILSYFGEQVALYFLWLHELIAFLPLLTAAGIACAILPLVTDKVPEGMAYFIFGVLSVLWGAAWLIRWRRTEQAFLLAYQQEELSQNEVIRDEYDSGSKGEKLKITDIFKQTGLDVPFIYRRSGDAEAARAERERRLVELVEGAMAVSFCSAPSADPLNETVMVVASNNGNNGKGNKNSNNNGLRSAAVTARGISNNNNDGGNASFFQQQPSSTAADEGGSSDDSDDGEDAVDPVDFFVRFKDRRSGERKRRQFVGAFVVLVVTCAYVALVTFLTYWRYLNVGDDIVSYACSILGAVGGAVISVIFDFVVSITNDLENYPTEKALESATILKRFFYSFFSFYYSMFIIALYPTKATNSERLEELKIQMIIICVAKPFVQNITELAFPILTRWWNNVECCCGAGIGRTLATRTKRERAGALTSPSSDLDASGQRHIGGAAGAASSEEAASARRRAAEVDTIDDDDEDALVARMRREHAAATAANSTAPNSVIATGRRRSSLWGSSRRRSLDGTNRTGGAGTARHTSRSAVDSTAPTHNGGATANFGFASPTSTTSGSPSLSKPLVPGGESSPAAAAANNQQPSFECPRVEPIAPEGHNGYPNDASVTEGGGGGARISIIDDADGQPLTTVVSAEMSPYEQRMAALIRETVNLKRQSNFAKYESVTADYMEVVLQFGFMVMFASTFPWAPLCALFYNIVEVKIDAMRHVWIMQRPIPQSSRGVGQWKLIMGILVGLALVTNAFFICVLSSAPGNLDINVTATNSWDWKSFIALQYMMVVIIFLMFFLWGGKPRAVRQMETKMAFLGRRLRFKNGLMAQSDKDFAEGKFK